VSRLQTNVSCTIVLENMRHIPNLHLNLIPKNTVDKEVYHQLGDGILKKLTKGSLLVAIGELCGMLYMTHVKVCSGQINAIKDYASLNL